LSLFQHFHGGRAVEADVAQVNDPVDAGRLDVLQDSVQGEQLERFLMYSTLEWKIATSPFNYTIYEPQAPC